MYYTCCDKLHPFEGHLLESVTLSPFDECLAVVLSISVLTTYVCQEFEQTTFLPHIGERSCQLPTAAVAQWVRAFAPQAEGWVFESKLQQTVVVKTRSDSSTAKR